MIQAQEHEGMGPLRGRRGITNKEKDFKNKNIESESTHSTQEVELEWHHCPSSMEPHDPLLPDTSYSCHLLSPLCTGNFRCWLG